MVRRAWGALCVAALLLLVGCGGLPAPTATGGTAQARTSASAPAAPPSPPPGLIAGEPWFYTRVAALGEAQLLVDSLPAYPGAKVVSRNPYQVAPPAMDEQGQLLPQPQQPVPAVMGAPLAADVIDLYRVWTVPAPATAVLAWAKAKLEPQYTLAGNGGGGSPRSFFLTFDVVSGEALPEIEVTVQVDGQQAKIRYDTMTEYVPPRPTREMLPPGPRSVTLTAITAGGPTVTATITGRPAIDTVMALVNALPRVPAGVGTCVQYQPGWKLALTFAYPAGQERQVTEASVCAEPDVIFGKPGEFPRLADPQMRLLNTARGLVHLPPIPASER